MSELVLNGMVIEVSRATVQPKGTHYDYLEIAQLGGNARRLWNVFVPASLQMDIGPCAIGEFCCRETSTGTSSNYEILAFRRADGAVEWQGTALEGEK